MEHEVVIGARDLRVGFGARDVIRGLDLDVYRGEILGLVGASGTGKSVLLRAIIGLLPVRGGSVQVLGAELARAGPAERARIGRRLGVLFQQGALFSSLSVRENVKAPMREHLRLAEGLMDELAGLKIAMVGLPPEAGDKMPSELSGGMVKRASLARALALDPEIVFLDEPTSGLDPLGAAEFDRLIRKLQETLGLTVFMVTHDLDSLFEVCDRVVAVGEGRVLAAGSIETVLECPHPWVQAYFHSGRAARRLAG
jgi:phospholipid/cholesterol/gamma-HCH transport system ATP-binding protein